MNRYSENYIMTIDPEWASDVAALEQIRENVREFNKEAKRKQRVVLRGRKPILKKIRTCVSCGCGHSAVSYDYFGNVVGGLKNAQRIDVYIYYR